MASASLLPFFRLRRIIPPQSVYAVEGGDRSEWWFTFHAGWAVVSLPYGMGKSINFTPALQNAVQSKKEAPETGASLRLL